MEAVADSGEAVGREYLDDLLVRWRDGVVSAPEAVDEARTLWLSREWQRPQGDSRESIALDILYLLADARNLGITHDDIPALLEYLHTPDGQEVHGRERFGTYIEGVQRSEREAIQADGYYGPPSGEAEVDRMEIAIPDPDQRRIHSGIRLDPESVWDEVRAQLCAPSPRDELFLDDIVEDLLHAHADAFIDRLEQLAAECPEALRALVAAHIGGIASSPALERFWNLQDRLERDLVARGEMSVWRRPDDLDDEHPESFR